MCLCSSTDSVQCPLPQDALKLLRSHRTKEIPQSNKSIFLMLCRSHFSGGIIDSVLRYYTVLKIYYQHVKCCGRNPDGYRSVGLVFVFDAVPWPYLVSVQHVCEIVLGHIEDGSGDGLGFDHGLGREAALCCRAAGLPRPPPLHQLLLDLLNV